MNRKRWIGRMCWIAAWGVWVWLVEGLYRELPRDIGPLVRSLQFQDAETAIGFLHDENVVVSDFELKDDPTTRFHLWDALDGRQLQTWIGPGYDPKHESRVTLRHGFAIGKRPDDRSQAPRLHTFNLRTGEWKRSQAVLSSVLDVNDRQPWIAVINDAFDGNPPKIFVIDLRTGETLLRWEAPKPKNRKDSHVFGCWFLPDTDDLLLSCHLSPTGAEMNETQSIECWNIPRQERLSQFTLDPPFLSMSPPSRNGRVVFERVWGDWDRVDLMDCRTGAVVYSNRSPEAAKEAETERGKHLGSAQAFQLSPSGRIMVLAESLFDLDRSRFLWKRRPAYEGIVERSNGNELLVSEDWNAVIQEYWKAPTIAPMFAVRDFDSGRVVRRQWERGFRGDSISTDRSLAVAKDGSVFRMPPRVNWTLFLGSTAILAAPLVLLWIVLRWRRRRSQRLRAGIEP